ncbi:MAG TPA: hypothetical protein VFA11_07475 [Acidimicrobiales bacterium]|nr:hypothetical protein [Acidimicrobiales bacterium]
MDTQDPAGLVRAAAGDGPDRGLEAVKHLRKLVDDWEEEQVRRARLAGWSWADIAARLGRHRQAVHREYASRNMPTGPAGGASQG